MLILGGGWLMPVEQQAFPKPVRFCNRMYNVRCLCDSLQRVGAPWHT